MGIFVVANQHDRQYIMKEYMIQIALGLHRLSHNASIELCRSLLISSHKSHILTHKLSLTSHTICACDLIDPTSLISQQRECSMHKAQVYICRCWAQGHTVASSCNLKYRRIAKAMVGTQHLLDKVKSKMAWCRSKQKKGTGSEMAGPGQIATQFILMTLSAYRTSWIHYLLHQRWQTTHQEGGAADGKRSSVLQWTQWQWTSRPESRWEVGYPDCPIPRP